MIPEDVRRLSEQRREARLAKDFATADALRSIVARHQRARTRTLGIALAVALVAGPLAGWAVKGAVAYAGTRALGEAAVRYFDRRTPVTRTDAGRARFP